MDVLALPFEARIAVPPLLLLSVEATPQALQSSWPEAYRPQAEYEGYFHHGLCYRDDAGILRPVQEADAAHYCADKLWSGNFLNWAGMSALDTLRYALTGGARVQDEQQMTVLARADLGNKAADSFNKRLDARQADIARLVPHDVARLFLRACGRRLQVWRVAPGKICGARADGLLSELDLQVEVCGARDRRPWLCKSYGEASKPEGLLQASAPWLRMALQMDERGFMAGGLIGAQSLGRNWTRQENPRPEWNPETGVMTPGNTLLRQLSRSPTAVQGDAGEAKRLQAATQAESGLSLASCQRTHRLRWPWPTADEQDGTAQLATLRRQFARLQRDLQRTALPAQISIAMNQDDALFVASTDAAQWSSSLRRYGLQAGAGGKPLLSTHAQWDAALPPAKQRQLLTTGNGADAGRLIALQAPQLTAAPLQALRDSPSTLRPDGLLQDRLAWLRGEAGVQESQGGKLADRLGIFAAQFGPNMAYLEAASGQEVVFMSSGEGLLHAIDAKNGKELFAWMPAALLRRLPAAAAPDFSAQSLLDGGISLGQIQVRGKNTPLLAVAGGRSARGVFALKLQDASRIDSSGWRAFEFTEANDERVGHVLQPPQILRIASRSGKEKSSRPFLLFSSGVNGVPGLFLLALDGVPGAPWVAGSNYFFFPAGADQASSASPLAPAAAVLDDQQNLRHAWAGDARGQLWRFSMVEDTRSAAGFALAVTLVFQAGSAAGEPQVISSAPRIAYGADQSWLLLFGTGQWLEVNDAAPGSARQESFYGVLDRPGAARVLQRADLTVRKAEASQAGFRVAGAKLTPTSAGWALDFPVRGERVTQSALLLDGRVLVTSLVAPEDPCDALAWRSWDLDAMQGTNPLATGRSMTRSLLMPLLLRGPVAPAANAFGQRAAGLASVLLDLPAPGAELDGIQMKSWLPVGRLAWREIQNWSRLHAAQSKP